MLIVFWLICTNKPILYTFCCFRHLLDDLIRVLGSPDLVDLPAAVTFRKAEVLLHDLLNLLQDLPELPNTKPDGFYPMDMFLHSEVEVLRTLVETIEKDARLLLSMARGEVATPPLYRHMLWMVSHHKIPTSWLKQTMASCLSVTQWTSELANKIHHLKHYVEVTTILNSGMKIFHFHGKYHFLLILE